MDAGPRVNLPTREQRHNKTTQHVLLCTRTHAQEKFTQYEEDVRVPMLMAGPGIPRGAATGPELQASLTDLTATILALAGAGGLILRLGEWRGWWGCRGMFMCVGA